MFKPWVVVMLLALLLGTAFGADFPTPFNSEKDLKEPFISAQDALARFKAPDGFKVQLSAAEPGVQNPIALSWDTRGRLWIAENYTYAERQRRFETDLRDRVLILEDADHDGRFEKRTVFTDTVQILTSIEVGRGGVWLMCPPQVLFIADTDGDDKPDGPPEVVLDGFEPPSENHHNFANGLRFGPDGWLYGRCGASSPGKLGAPGTPAAERVPLTGGMWRYHPESKVVEALCSGTTNPWGHDWNEKGDLFFINTVNGHLWHVTPGAHFVRPHTIDPNPSVYEMIDQHADHFHFDTGKSWTASRDGAADAFGGGHAHQGLMIYQGNNWPKEYHGKLFTVNFHGRRLNVENLARRGGGYVGQHQPDFAASGDKWFRGLDLSSGPDGGVVLLDWSDTGECHDNTGVHRTSGRIYKITNGDAKRPDISDLTKLAPTDLAKLVVHENVWHRRAARNELANRKSLGKPVEGAASILQALFREKNTPHRLETLWTLYVLGEASANWLKENVLTDEDEYARSWALRLLADRLPLDWTTSARHPRAGRESDQAAEALLPLFAERAANDPSAHVRLTLASILQRLPFEKRLALAEPLLQKTADAQDHDIPLMLWYGLIPTASAAPDALAATAAKAQIPTTRRYIARRLAELVDRQPAAVNALLAAVNASPDNALAVDILRGLSEGFVGRRKAAKPAAWDALAQKINAGSDAALKDRVRELSVLFGDGRALDELKALALDGKADLNNRRAALQTLIESKPADLREICEKLLGTRFLNAVAVKGLALFDDPLIGDRIAKSYKSFHPSDRPQVLESLVSRPSFALALLESVAANRVPRGDISPYHARQMRNMGDDALNKRLGEVWGEMREADGDRKVAMEKLKAQMTPQVLAAADKSRGRELFAKTCSACHKLYGEGGSVGPDLTGAGRDNIDYLLENIVDPSAVLSADFRVSIVQMNDGRVLNGIVVSKNEKSMTLQTMNERVTVDAGEVKKARESKQSLMPDGLLEPLAPEQVRDLFGYLMHRSQVPLPAK